MALQLHADGVLVYDSRLDDRKLLGLNTTEGLNKAGTATITMPPQHPGYNSFTSYRTVVTLHENGALRFRGRALYPADDWLNCRTVTCEGERGFLQDNNIRPFLFQDTPAAIFAAALAQYNAEADDFKRFTLGEVTVTDPNDYVRLESESAMTYAAFFDKLVERCGGFITFSDNGNGGRAINWLAEIGTRSQQAIEFGENLLEFTRSGQSAGLATGIRPYGAQLEDGGRVTIESVTANGADWIKDEEAAELRGTIIATQTWDDVTEPANLLAKAKQWLAANKLAITSLQLTAADLSKLDRRIGGYHVGDLVQVISKPHGVNEWFQLTDRAVDWLDPAGSKVNLGKTQASLTGLDVAGDRESASALDKIQKEVTTAYKNGIAAAVKQTSLDLASEIQQSAERILQRVSETYTSQTDTDTLRQFVESQLTVLADGISGAVTQTMERINEVDGDLQTKFNTITKYFTFDINGLTIGQEGNPYKVVIDNDRYSMIAYGVEVLWFDSEGKGHIPELNITKLFSLFGFQIDQDAAGNVNCEYVGG